MSFPHDDRPWADTAGFLRERMGATDRVVAPDPFRFAIPRATRFGQIRGETPKNFDWIVVHKGELDRIPRGFLTSLSAQAVPVFANEVFVVFASSPAPDLSDQSETDHVRAFAVGVESLPPAPATPPPPNGISAIRVPAAPMAPVVRGLRAARPVREPGQAPTRPWQIAGSIPGVARERAFQEELDRLVVDYVGTAEGMAVLDIGCGSGRLAPLLTEAASVTGVDLAAEALARARSRHAQLPGFRFVRMDAAQLGFEAASFDLALMLDVLDMLADPAAALAEAARVLARGGRLMVTATNKDSLPFRAMRRLSLPVPLPGVSVQELSGMLRAVGLSPVRMDGLFLSLGWSLPGIGGAMGALEEDPEFIEAMRLLGRRCGPDQALVICMMARKD